jgi:hypothetical protein
MSRFQEMMERGGVVEGEVEAPSGSETTDTQRGGRGRSGEEEEEAALGGSALMAKKEGFQIVQGEGVQMCVG